jgi:2-succinyl-5-enolpyruvyl-6-hydroxy-3-cyclohexene-1-carboxylate synthase
MALALDAPVALLSTSGTAAVNFHPAIVEAFMSQVPLLVLTTDRPPELRHSGANQTIDQIKMYGDHVLWSVDMALPAGKEPDVSLRNLSTLAGRALGIAGGLQKGPVHLNFPFRKPLEPSLDEAKRLIAGSGQEESGALEEMDASKFITGRISPPRERIEEISDLLALYERGLIICGPRCPGDDFPAAVADLSRRVAYPILADALSGLRFGSWQPSTSIIGGYESFLAGQGPKWTDPDVIVRFGALPTSKSLNMYLDRIQPKRRIHVRSNGVWADDSHRTNLFLQADEALTCSKLAELSPPRIESAWQDQVCQTERKSWEAMGQALAVDFFDGAAVADVLSVLPEGSLLFAGNSLPVRHVDQFTQPCSKQISVQANRGASGIDGVTSTALGVAAATGQPVVLIIGDLSFYHDLTALETAARLNLNITIVVVNNHGGSIFRRLPVSRIEPPFEELFLTPHNLNFKAAADMAGISFEKPHDQTTLRRALGRAVADPSPVIIELETDGRHDHERWREVTKKVQGHITGGK